MSEFVVYRRSFWHSIGGFLVGLAAASPSAYGEFNARSEFTARLVAPYSVALESSPFRSSVEGVAATAKLNLWIDRTIDPDGLVSPGPVAPTVYECLVKIAAEQDSVVFAIENFVLIGKPDRVDAAASAILAIKNAAAPASTSTETLTTVSWDRLATPSEAFSQATGRAATAEMAPKLPHDHWHETTWQDVDRDVAASLVLPQLGLRLVQPGVTTRGPGAPATEPIDGLSTTVTYQYRTESVPPAARKAVQSLDPKATFKVQPGGMDVSTTATGHRLLTHALLQTLAPANRAIVAGGDALETLKKDKRAFTLRLANKPAKDVFAFLAQSANVNFEIDAGAKEKCEQWVSLEAKDASLLQLMEQVAERAQVKLEWEPKQFRVTAQGN